MLSDYTCLKIKIKDFCLSFFSVLLVFNYIMLTDTYFFLYQVYQVSSNHIFTQMKVFTVPTVSFLTTVPLRSQGPGGIDFILRQVSPQPECRVGGSGPCARSL